MQSDWDDLNNDNQKAPEYIALLQDKDFLIHYLDLTLRPGHGKI